VANIPAGDVIAAESSTVPLPDRDVVSLELPGPGRASDPARDVASLRERGVRWVIVSGAVTDRVLAVPDRYPVETRFYEQLGHGFEPAFAVSSSEQGLAGPWVRIYRIAE
jgi:hypothetical protein